MAEYWNKIKTANWAGILKSVVDYSAKGGAILGYVLLAKGLLGGDSNEAIYGGTLATGTTSYLILRLEEKSKARQNRKGGN